MLRINKLKPKWDIFCDNFDAFEKKSFIVKKNRKKLAPNNGTINRKETPYNLTNKYEIIIDKTNKIN
tara:strand:+ start:324 stop:524 length:201 start_codon:yes stop_codon:yes gene_type:complete